MWNPIDLGYSATQIAYDLVKEETDGQAGRASIDAAASARSSSTTTARPRWPPPFVFDKPNIEEFSQDLLSRVPLSRQQIRRASAAGPLLLPLRQTC